MGFHGMVVWCIFQIQHATVVDPELAGHSGKDPVYQRDTSGTEAGCQVMIGTRLCFSAGLLKPNNKD